MDYHKFETVVVRLLNDNVFALATLTHSSTKALMDLSYLLSV